MSKKQKYLIRTVVFGLIAAAILFCIGYRIHADRNRIPTEAEIEAEKTTARLKAEREATRMATAPETTTQQETEGEEDAVVDIADRYIVEEPEVYEDYEPATEAQPEEVYTAADKWENGEYNFTSDEIWEMTRIVYLENGITYPECTYQTVYLTACAILNRLYDWEECSTIYEVIWEPGQYSTADRYHDYNGSDLGTSNPDGWAISEEAVWNAISNTDRNPHFQSMGVQGEVYYIDPITGEVFCY